LKSSNAGCHLLNLLNLHNLHNLDNLTAPQADRVRSTTTRTNGITLDGEEVTQHECRR